MEKSFVSVVIAAKNASGTLRKCLDSIMALHDSACEVIVVNDGSADTTAVIAAVYPGITLINTSHAGCSGARNLGVRHARGEFVAFVDADSFVGPGWLDALRTGFVSPQVAGVGGIQKSPEDERPFGKKVQTFFLAFGFISNYMQFSSTLKEVKHNANCNVLYRKAAFDEIGGFWASPLAGEDVDLDHRLRKKGYRLMMNPDAVIFHYRTQTFKGFADMMFRYGMGQGRLVRLHGMFRWIHGLPFFTLGAGALLVVGLLTQTGLTISLYGIVLLGLLCRVAFDPTLTGLSVIAFAAWNAGFLKSFFVHKCESQ